MNRVTRYGLMVSMVLLFVICSVVLADDGRINPPPYHFGGDALYCNQQNGCTLLNKTGQFLWNWPQLNIANAFEMVDKTGQKTLVGDGTGTYGTASLWAVPTDETNGNKHLCMFGFDEWGKQNYMCFSVTADWNYLPIQLVGGPSIPDCSAFAVKDFVALISNLSDQGPIKSINRSTGMVVFGFSSEFRASCDQIHKVT